MAETYKRNIRFQYYQIKYIVGEKTDSNRYHVFNMEKWAKMMKDNKMIKKTVEFNDAVARLDSIEYFPSSKLWGIKLIKLRDTNIPSKVKEYEEVEVIDLEPNEYIGEDLFLLYDSENGIAMIQQNRYSLGVSRVEEFIKETYNRFSGTKISVSIEAVLQSNDIKKLRKSKYRYLELSFANIDSYTEEDGKNPLGRIMQPFKDFHGITGTIKISLGHTKGGTLNRTEVQELIETVNSNKRFVRTAKLKVKEDDDADVEWIDLFSDVMYDIILFELKVRGTLDESVALSTMQTYFQKKRDSLIKLVNPRGN